MPRAGSKHPLAHRCQLWKEKLKVQHFQSFCFLPQISDQVSAQVRDEVRTQVYGNQMVRGGTSTETAPPESLLQWLSQRYVSGTEMQAELSSLELRVLQNISQQLEQYRGEDAAGDSTGIVITQKVGRGGLTDNHMWSDSLLKSFTHLLSLPGCTRDCRGRSASVLSGQNQHGGLRSGVWRLKSAAYCNFQTDRNKEINITC